MVQQLSAVLPDANPYPVLPNGELATNLTSWGASAGTSWTWTAGVGRYEKGTSSDPYVYNADTNYEVPVGVVIHGRARVRGTGGTISGLLIDTGWYNSLNGPEVSLNTGGAWTIVNFTFIASQGPSTGTGCRYPVIWLYGIGTAWAEIDWCRLYTPVANDWPIPADGDMVCDPSTGRAMLYKSGAWSELNATMAYQLATARTFSLANKVAGSVTTDLAGNVSMLTDVLDYTHYHQLGITWGYFSGSLGCVNNGQQIPWSGGQVAGPGVTGPAYTGNSIRFGKAGWWFYGVTAQMNDQTGAGKTVLEANGTHYGVLGVNHDSAGRWGGMAGGFVLSGGGDTITPYFNVGTVQQICSFAMFFGVWMRP